MARRGRPYATIAVVVLNINLASTGGLYLLDYAGPARDRAGRPRADAARDPLAACPAPDAAVFLDGLNRYLVVIAGHQTPVQASRARDAWERSRREARVDSPWVKYSPSFPLARVAAWVRHRTANPVPAQNPYVRRGATAETVVET